MRQDDGAESVPRWQSAFSSEDGHEISSPDRLFDALSARLRRQALFYLLEEPETTIDDLADVLAGWRSTATGPVGPTERERIAVELRHVHLPRLDEATLVEFDSVAGDVRLRELPDPVRELVRFAHRYDNTAEETV